MKSGRKFEMISKMMATTEKTTIKEKMATTETTETITIMEKMTIKERMSIMVTMPIMERMPIKTIKTMEIRTIMASNQTANNSSAKNPNQSHSKVKLSLFLETLALFSMRTIKNVKSISVDAQFSKLSINQLLLLVIRSIGKDMIDQESHSNTMPNM